MARKKTTVATSVAAEGTMEAAATEATEEAEAAATEATEEAAAAAETEAAAAEAALETVAYCGPTIKGVAKRNTVYKGIPKALAEYVAAHKYARALVVPVARMGETLSKLRDKQSAEYKIYNKILKEGGK